MTQELKALTIRPVQVVEHEHDWLDRGGGGQKARHCSVEKITLGIGIRPRRYRNIPESLNERGNHRRDSSAMGLDVGSKHVLGCVRHEMVQRFNERRIWPADIFLATSQEYAGTFPGGAPSG